MLALKVLLEQADLATPFTGGLGSYKLYVLVAYHMRQHLALGGRDLPGEAFLSFLYRYSSAFTYHYAHPNAHTRISQEGELVFDERTSADFSNTFRLSDVSNLFHTSWRRLSSLIEKHGQSSNQKGKASSFLSGVMNVEALRDCRKQSKYQAGRFLQLESSKSNQQASLKRAKNASSCSLQESDLTAQQLMAGYNITDITSFS